MTLWHLFFFFDLMLSLQTQTKPCKWTASQFFEKFIITSFVHLNNVSFPMLKQLCLPFFSPPLRHSPPFLKIDCRRGLLLWWYIHWLLQDIYSHAIHGGFKLPVTFCNFQSNYIPLLWLGWSAARLIRDRAFGWLFPIWWQCSQCAETHEKQRLGLEISSVWVNIKVRSCERAPARVFLWGVVFDFGCVLHLAGCADGRSFT